MGQVSMELSPPLYWQAFQELTVDLCRFLWPDGSPVDVFGRDGQAQNGVDVFVWQEEKITGIQCKKRRRTKADGVLEAGGDFSGANIKAMIKEAEGFQPELSHFIIATTGLRDSATQRHMLKVSQERAKSGKFTVDIWFWDRFQIEINNHSELLYRHYELVLKSRQDYDSELHLMTVLQTAFTRPAFDTPLFSEHRGPDFCEAMQDTQTALTTGILVDREFRERIIDRAPFGIEQLSKKNWKDRLEKVRSNIQKVRDIYKQALSEGGIEEYPGGVRGDPQVEHEIDSLRVKAISELNKVLQKANLEPVGSRLIRN